MPIRRNTNDRNHTIPTARGMSATAREMIANSTGHVGREDGSTGRIKLPPNADFATLYVPDQRNFSQGTQQSSGGEDKEDSALLNPAAYRINGAEMTFDDIIDMKRVKNEVRQKYFQPLLTPHLFRDNQRPPSMIMYGPPGNGKTYVTRAIIGEMNRRSPGSTVGYHASASSIGSRYQNETEKNIRALWMAVNQEATSRQRDAVSVIFLDEIEGLAASRGVRSERDDGSTVALLEVMDGVTAYPRVKVIGATNLPWMIDSAINSRFNIKIFIDLPSDLARHATILQMMQVMCTDKNCLTDRAIVEVVKQIVAWTGPSRAGDDEVIAGTGMTVREWHAENDRMPSDQGRFKHGYSMRDLNSLFDAINASMAQLMLFHKSTKSNCSYVSESAKDLRDIVMESGGAAVVDDFDYESIARAPTCDTAEFHSLRYSPEFIERYLKSVAIKAIDAVPSTVNPDEYIDLVIYHKTKKAPSRK